MIAHSHDPATCRCENCRVEQTLIDTGGWEWVDDWKWVDEGRPARKPKPGPYCNPYYIISAVMLAWALVLLALLVAFGG